MFRTKSGYRSISLLLLMLVLAFPAAARAVGDPNVAGLQVALRARGLYAGTIDGVIGPGTRRALGRWGRHRYSTRMLHGGMRGWDVAGLQFRLAWHGFPSGPIDGDFGPRTLCQHERRVTRSECLRQPPGMLRLDLVDDGLT